MKYWTWILCAPLVLALLLLGVLLAPLLFLICFPFWIWNWIQVAIQDRQALRAPEQATAHTESDVAPLAASIALEGAPLSESHEGVTIMQQALQVAGSVPEQQPAEPEPVTRTTFSEFQRDFDQFLLSQTRRTFQQPVTEAETRQWFALAHQYQQELRELSQEREREVGE